MRGDPAEFWPQQGEGLSPKFAQNRVFSPKIAWKLHGVEEILGARGPAPSGRPWIRYWFESKHNTFGQIGGRAVDIGNWDWETHTSPWEEFDCTYHFDPRSRAKLYRYNCKNYIYLCFCFCLLCVVSAMRGRSIDIEMIGQCCCCCLGQVQKGHTFTRVGFSRFVCGYRSGMRNRERTERLEAISNSVYSPTYPKVPDYSFWHILTVVWRVASCHTWLEDVLLGSFLVP